MTEELLPTISQQKVLNSIKSFILSDKERVFILKGYAGTGKTTMMRFLVKWLHEVKKDYYLLAPTGRAAKVLSNISNEPARTIHSLIYRYSDFNQDVDKIEVDAHQNGQLYLVFESAMIDEDTGASIYIIDEASMIADSTPGGLTQASFGSGRLLSDFLNYDTRNDSKFIFIGDPCQLPPVGEIHSPALDVNYFNSKQILCREAQLTEILRQKEGNSIIAVSKAVRGFYDKAPEDNSSYPTNGFRTWGKLPLRGCADIIIHKTREEMLSQYLTKIGVGHYNDATFLCRGNNTCNKDSIEIRHRLGFNNELVQAGDLLLVTQNNLLSGLVNGDMVEVIDVSSYSTMQAGLRFRQVTVRKQFSKEEFSQLLIENVIAQVQPNLDSQQQTALNRDFVIRMRNKGIRAHANRDIFNDALRHDVYLNALRCSYGYALTCNKAQGGEWDDVYIDFPRGIVCNPTKASYQWIYTAITRAKKHMHLVDDFFVQ